MISTKEWSKALLLGMFGFALTFIVVPAAHAKAPYKIQSQIVTLGAAPLGDPASTVTAFGVLVHERTLPQDAGAINTATYGPKFYSAETRKAWIALEEAKTKDLAAKFSASFTETLGKKPVEVALRKLDPAQGYIPALAADAQFTLASFGNAQGAASPTSPGYVKDLLAKAGAEQFVLIESSVSVYKFNILGTQAEGIITLQFSVYNKDGLLARRVYVTKVVADKKTKKIKPDDPDTFALLYDAAVKAIPDAVKQLWPKKK